MEQTAAPEVEGLIDRYCAGRGITLKAFQDLAGISRTALYRVRTGDTEVSTDIFDKIQTATDGQIKAVELFAEWHAKRQSAEAADSARPARANA